MASANNKQKEKDDDDDDYQPNCRYELESRRMSKRALNIESSSFKIIDAEVGDHLYDKLEWPIVRRAIHSTADFDFAQGDNRIVFGNHAIESAFNAIKNRCSIVTDVEMVVVSINKKLIANLGLKKPVCHISNKKLISESRKTNKTRSELAMRYSAKDMYKGIVAIGNAPTALYETIKMIKEGVARPALVIGVPVGFVSALESKKELSMTQVPFITNTGRKGGSPVASSIVNAILLLYEEIQAARTTNVRI
ncbi:MAG TPA: precorrin-8X methylmutase [Nitrososphaeraceae archaeon]